MATIKMFRQSMAQSGLLNP